MSNKHHIFVLSNEGKPLTPTTPARARKLIQGGVASPIWSKFQTFGIQMLVETRSETPQTALGYDAGTKFEGFAVVCGVENTLAIRLDLPDKKRIVRKLEERRILRRARRQRKCRRRAARFDNRKREGFVAPSQLVVVNSRLKVLREFLHLYPIKFVAFEDVKFNHAKKRWGANFSTVEIGKTKIKKFIADCGTRLLEYQGFETAELREKYGYQKSKDKRADVFNAHCSDALALAVDVVSGVFVAPGRFFVVNDAYRPVRRKLHDTQPAKGGKREVYSKGTVFGISKGALIGSIRGGLGNYAASIKVAIGFMICEASVNPQKKSLL